MPVPRQMPIPRPDAHSTARCPFHNQMPIPQPDARSTTRCPFHPPGQTVKMRLPRRGLIAVMVYKHKETFPRTPPNHNISKQRI
ncbi:MAG: hypothetical protein F6K26_45555 [Moorea sp. SIO2I5]|nr:hypothetical protein [Moorena sp. SIO2I5]